MTFRDLVLIVGRRWYVVVGSVAIAVAGFALSAMNGGVYVTKPIIAFVLPGAGTLAADNGLEVEGVIAFASAVAESVNNGRPIERYAAEDAPLYGAGVSEEVRVGVPNVGGQWGTSFTRAEIAISIVGKSHAWVEEMQQEMVDRVTAAANAEQKLRGVPASARIEPELLPLSTNIEHVSSSTSQRVMAFTALTVAALIVGCCLATLLDGVIVGKSARWQRSGRRSPDRAAAAMTTGVGTE
jgi:hypothetical protein